MSTTMKGSTCAQLGLGILLTTTMIFANGCGSKAARPPVIQNLYVINADGYNPGDASITKFALPASATVDVAPTQNINGVATGMVQPHRTAADASGNIYVTDYSQGTVSVFAPTATGNIAPTTTIHGPNTGLNSPSGIAIDSRGNIYVADTYAGGSSTGAIFVFAAGATGDATPIATITDSSLNNPNGLALDSHGNIWVINEGNNTITEYAANPTGTEAPIVTIGGAGTGLNDPHALALDSADNIYAVNGNQTAVAGGSGSDGNSVTVYAVGATGNATPTATISGTNTTFNNPNGIAVDAKGNIYVGNQASVDVYGAHPSGNVTTAPLYVLGGSSTTLTHVHGVSVN